MLNREWFWIRLNHEDSKVDIESWDLEHSHLFQLWSEILLLLLLIGWQVKCQCETMHLLQLKDLSFSCVSVYGIRVDSVSSSQDGVKSRELGSAALYDVLPPSCPDQPAVPSNVYAAADTNQEEGEASKLNFFHVRFALISGSYVLLKCSFRSWNVRKWNYTLN